jgi:hypothetical protein
MLDSRCRYEVREGEASFLKQEGLPRVAPGVSINAHKSRRKDSP